MTSFDVVEKVRNTKNKEGRSLLETLDPLATRIALSSCAGKMTRADRTFYGQRKRVHRSLCSSELLLTRLI